MALPCDYIKLNQEQCRSDRNIVKWRKKCLEDHSSMYYVSVKWIIHNFKINSTITSGEFSIGEENFCKWQLQLSAKNKMLQRNSYLLDFKIIEENYELHEFKTDKMYIANFNFHSLKPGESHFNTLLFNVLEFQYFDVEKVLKNKSLKLVCYFRVFVQQDVFINQVINPQLQDSSRTETTTDIDNNQLKIVFNNKKFIDFQLFEEFEKFSDMIINIQNHEIKVHKFVLAACSPIFSKNLQNTTTNVIEITDMNYKTMEYIIEYFYTGKIEKINLSELPDLLKASNKYFLEDVKLKCQEILITNLNDDNVIEMIKVASLSQAEQLKEEVVNYIVNNIKNFKGYQFRSIIDEFPIIIEKIFDKL